MSEIQRFDIRGESWGIVERTDGLGAFCWYEEAAWYKRGYFIAIVTSIIVSLAFGFVCSLLVYEKASHGPVAVPMGAGEKAELLKENSALQKEKEAIQKQRDDQIKLNANYRAQIKALNAKEGSHVAQLEALQARGREISQLNKEQAQRMSTNQGLVLEAERVLHVKNVKVVDQ